MKRATALLLVMAGLAAGQADTLEQAWTAAAKGNTDAAIGIARHITQAEPGNPEAHLLLGSLLMEQGERTISIQELKTAVRLKPESADGWNALGEALHTFGRTNAAREPFERAIQLKPDFGVAHMNLGAVLLQAGDPAAAAQQLDVALRLLGETPDAVETHYLRAKVSSAMGQSDEAIQHLEAAVRLNPQMAAAWSDLGEARRLKSDTGSLADFERAVQLNAGDAVAQYRLGAELLRREQTAAALEHLEKAYRIAPEDQSVLNALQAAYRTAGRMADAVRVKQELAAVLKARDVKSQTNLKALRLNNEGAELQKTGDMAGAVGKYSEALKLSPGHNGIRLNYAVALLRLGQWTAGLDQLHAAAQQDPDDEKVQAAMQDALAQAPKTALPEWARTVH